jgi:hypothetical protein
MKPFRFAILILRMVLLVVLPGIACLSYAQTFTTFDMPNSTFTQPAAINPAGQITGTYQDIASVEHGFLRQKDGTLISFDAPLHYYGGPLNHTGATSINAAGQITGYVYHPTDPSYGFLRDAVGSFVIFGGWCFGPTPLEDVFTTLTTGPIQFGLEGTTPTAINDVGQTAGMCGPGAQIFYGFLRNPDGTFTVFLPTNNNFMPRTKALAINSRGQITGVYTQRYSFDYHGFLREPDGTATTFDAPSSNGQPTIPTAINPRGEITGYTDQGFLRQLDGSILTFGVPNSISTQPASINPRGDIAGVYLDAGNIAHGFLRDKHGTITTFDVPNAINTYPTGINPRGDIIGWYSDAGGVHGFVRGKR